MACIRQRRGKWVVDYRDAAGVRRWVTCDTKRKADDVLAEKIKESRQAAEPLSQQDREITLADYAVRWQEAITMSVTPETAAHYADLLRRYVLPRLGRFKVRQLHRGMIKNLVVTLRNDGKSKNTGRLAKAVLSSLLTDAVEDRIIQVNPALQLGRKKQKGPQTVTQAERREKVRPLAREQLAQFLATAEAEPETRRDHPCFLTLARAGLRPGEARALKWEDIDLQGHKITVERSLTIGGRLKTTKTGESRVVDMSEALARTLRRLQAQRKAETLKRGWSQVPEWVFCSTAGTPLDHAHLVKVFKRVLKNASLPLNHRVYDLRHTYATLLLAGGVPITYVAAQLGHAKPTTTLAHYAHWINSGGERLVDVLDEAGGNGEAVASGSKTVANVVAKVRGTPQRAPQVFENPGDGPLAQLVEQLTLNQ